MEIIAQRVFNTLYIYLDIVFLLLLIGLLICKKKYLTLLFGLSGGLIYFIVDYGIFHLLLGTRSIEGGNIFWVLLWMSFSYGITNFVWIWLWLSKDDRLFSWSLLIICWWIACPLMASGFGHGFEMIHIQRTTSSYHAYMAVIMFIGYAMLAINNIFANSAEKKINIPWILGIGLLVQFAWEFSLLIGGIRSAGLISFESKITTLLVNSLLETNMGLPFIFFIQRALRRKYSEKLVKT